MKRWLQSRRFWLVLLLLLMLPLSAVLYLRQSTVNPMHAALDELSGISQADRWSHPQMLKIRELGPKAIPPLRQVLREKNDPSIRFLLWVKTKWPNVTKYYSRFPDTAKLSDRRHTACQILQTLGSTARPTVPELVSILKNGDIGDINSAIMVLYSIGIDADICDRLAALWEKEKGLSESARSQIVNALGSVKPPSERTLKVLVSALSDPSPWVPYGAAETLGRLGVRTPEIVSALKQLQSTTTNELSLTTASTALWELEKDANLVLPPVVKVLKQQLNRPYVPFGVGGGSGGQGVTAEDQSFMAAADLFSKMNLTETNRAAALGLLESWTEKSHRIFISMLLLPSMMDLGYPREKCVEVCRTGLNQSEDYYRLQAAQLLITVSEKHPIDEIDINTLVHDGEVGVRVYASKIHWRKYHQAKVVVPVLIESLDRTRHQSYYFQEFQPVALATLGEIGPEAIDAIAALEKATHDPNPAAAKLATNALARIRR